MDPITDSNFETLLSICEAFFPGLSGEELDAAKARIQETIVNPDWENIERVFRTSCKDLPYFVSSWKQFLCSLPKHGRIEFSEMLRLLESDTTNPILKHSALPFADHPRQIREKIVYGWSQASSPNLISFYNTIRTVSLTLFQEADPFIAKAMGYPIENDPEEDKKRFDGKEFHKFKFLEIKENTEIEADFVIVGSGAGGGVAAAKLAKAFPDKKVVVLEKGRFIPQENLPLPYTKVSEIIDPPPIANSADMKHFAATGRTWGGGTAVNYSCSFETPPAIRKEWAEKHGVEFALSPEYQASVDRVTNRMGVSTAGIKHNPGNQSLIDGCEALGLPNCNVPQNSAGKEHNCGKCMLGCRYGEKQGCTVTWLVDAEKAGAVNIQGCFVDRVIIEDGVTKGVEGTVDGKKLVIRAPRVFAAGGALRTPGLLQRSGITHPGVGGTLKLQPIVVVLGYFDNKLINPANGTLISRECTALTGITPEGYLRGAKIFTSSHYPAGFALANTPYTSGAEFKHDVLRYKQTAAYICVAKDIDSTGTVRYNPINKEPHFLYNVGEEDEKVLKEAQATMARIFLAAGASKIVAPRERGAVCDVFKRSSPDEEESSPAFQIFLSKIQRGTISCVFSAHPMSTVRMGATEDYPVDLEGKVRGVEGLYVVDGSIMPTALLVNPMVTIMSLSDWICEGLIQRLKK